MTSNVTANRGYQLPDAANKLKDDVLRVIAALSAIDADVAGLLLALANKSDVGHGHGMAAITGLVAALGNKLDAGYHDALANLTDVDVAGVANGMALLRQASKWIPVALQVNNIAGLETALNGKATPADITAAINALVAAAPGQLDTLIELATALGNDPNFAATMSAALADRVAFSAQSKSAGEMLQARSNTGAASAADVADLMAFLIGATIDYTGAVLPAKCVWPNGQNLSRTSYALLFAKWGTTYGAGDGTTTFGTPDLRGRVIAGKDDMGGVSSNRLTNPGSTANGVDGDVLGGAGGNEGHLLLFSEMTTGLRGVESYSPNINAGWNTPNNASVAHNNVQPTFILNKIIFAGQ